ncbi:hypothetical protein [Serratia liquefaciens]|uniref:hypothetical protein n=1 Tax=Serratia TaxID=613 RepID=UPI003704AA61
MQPSTGNPLRSLQGIPILALALEAVLDILIEWLRNNIDGETTLIVDNDEDNTHPAALFPSIEQARNDVRDLSRLLQHEKSE